MNTKIIEEGIKKKSVLDDAFHARTPNLSVLFDMLEEETCEIFAFKVIAEVASNKEIGSICEFLKNKPAIVSKSQRFWASLMDVDKSALYEEYRFSIPRILNFASQFSDENLIQDEFWNETIKNYRICFRKMNHNPLCVKVLDKIVPALIKDNQLPLLWPIIEQAVTKIPPSKCGTFGMYNFMEAIGALFKIIPTDQFSQELFLYEIIGRHLVDVFHLTENKWMYRDHSGFNDFLTSFQFDIEELRNIEPWKEIVRFEKIRRRSLLEFKRFDATFKKMPVTLSQFYEREFQSPSLLFKRILVTNLLDVSGETSQFFSKYLNWAYGINFEVTKSSTRISFE